MYILTTQYFKHWLKSTDSDVSNVRPIANGFTFTSSYFVLLHLKVIALKPSFFHAGQPVASSLVEQTHELKKDLKPFIQPSEQPVISVPLFHTANRLAAATFAQPALPTAVFGLELTTASGQRGLFFFFQG